MKSVMTYRCPRCEAKKLLENKDDPVIKCDFCDTLMIRQIPRWITKLNKQYKET